MASTKGTFSDLERITDWVFSQPVDLTDERVNNKRVWQEYMSQAISNYWPKDEFFGHKLETVQIDIRHPIVKFGRTGSKSVGKLLTTHVTRNDGEHLILATIPDRLGGKTHFVCRASSEDYAAGLRLLFKTLA